MVYSSPDPALPPQRPLFTKLIKHILATIDPSQPFHLPLRSFALATTMCPNLNWIVLTFYGSPTPHPASRNTHGSPLSFARQKNSTPTFDEEMVSILCSASCTHQLLRSPSAHIYLAQPP
ncbi:uncharacterized protein STEHIDRAFT_164193 [Stereum hirsutum FP-91666 SS1]|uniref:Uncharacterized protein n=1 Tax=Stereum hirsutum (strain FP-91666) TaxID=721885 RepID=R7RWZ6_STEHR|nr:uncharacterized protein STEHIDRAFT_164193 [Stereum hirsutum FP-91666 SS1]EIM78927.1 hypothetical protein STEHIDRAFT_164193 [Stereum hirsutum FP-91666 SS1]